MTSFNEIDEFYGLVEEAPANTDGSPIKKTRQPKPQCPARDSCSVAQFQFFDNGDKPGKGRSQHVIMVEIYQKPWGINLRYPDWFTHIQMLAPKKVIRWAEDQLEDGKITQEQFELYDDAKKLCDTFLANDPDADWAKIGHVESGIGSTYYIGQFLILLVKKDGSMEAHLFVGNDMITCPKFVVDKRKRAAGARKSFGFFDPEEILLRQREAQNKGML